MKRIYPATNLRLITGFTLIELLVVAVILAVLTGIALPRYTRSVARSREAEGWAFLTAIRSSELRYYMEHNEVFTTGAAAFTRLDMDDPQGLPVSLFNYCVAAGGTAQQFTAKALPRGTCGGCQTLCLDQDGVRGTGGPCGGC